MKKIKILDVGASDTIEKMPKALFNISDLYLIEARDTQENQDDFIKDKQFSNVKVFNYCISDNNEKTNLYVTNVEEASSLYKPNDQTNKFWREDNAIKLKEKIPINAITLEKFIIDNHINHIDLLNISAQASELKILKGLQDKIKNISLIICQTEFIEIYENQPLFNDLMDFLNKNNFEFLGFKELLKFEDKMINGTAIFINKGNLDHEYKLQLVKILSYLNFNENAKWIIHNSRFSIDEKKQILKTQLDQLNVIQRFLFNIVNFTNKFLINNFIFDKLKPYLVKILKHIPGSKKILIAFSFTKH